MAARRGNTQMRLLAGAAGFEPANAGTKNRCLTTWRRPSRRSARAGEARLIPAGPAVERGDGVFAAAALLRAYGRTRDPGFPRPYLLRGPAGGAGEAARGGRSGAL